MEFAKTNNICFHELNESEITTVDGGIDFNLCKEGVGCMATGYLIAGAGVFTYITKKDTSSWITSGNVANDMISRGKAMIVAGLLS